MLKILVMFVLGFILGIAFSIEAISKNQEKEKKEVIKNMVTEKQTTRIEVSLPYLIPSFSTEEAAVSAAKQISEEYTLNEGFLSISQYNDIFQFPQENPLHRMYGWKNLDKMNYIEIFEQDGAYKLRMPNIGPLL